MGISLREEIVMPNTTDWTPDAQHRYGNPTEIESSAAGKRGGARKLDANQLDAVWDEVQALNRAAGPWGVLVREVA
jgi:hypothetical protein